MIFPLAYSLRRAASWALIFGVVLSFFTWSAPDSSAITISAVTGAGAAAQRGRMIGQTIPIHITVPSTSIDSGSESIPTSVEVSSVPTTGGTIQIGTDHPSVVASPTGVWPYQHWFAPGSGTTVSLNLATSSVAAQTQVKIYACEAGVDSSNPANWTVVGTVTVVP